MKPIEDKKAQTLALRTSYRRH